MRLPFEALTAAAALAFATASPVAAEDARDPADLQCFGVFIYMGGQSQDAAEGLVHRPCPALSGPVAGTQPRYRLARPAD